MRRTLPARLASSPTVRKIAVVVAVVLAYEIWLDVQASGKVADDVGQVRNERGRYSADVEIKFAPERYHVLELQKHGRIAGTDGNVVHLRGVSPAGTEALARKYWIRRISAPTG
nr:hypothetical protein [Kibdelosporangium sp. MJ126-NF4]